MLPEAVLGGRYTWGMDMTIEYQDHPISMPIAIYDIIILYVYIMFVESL